jgi:SAM-dependent methyltransferase
MTEYILDNAWQQARRRLALLEAELDPGTTRHLQALGVAEGWRCLEVGGGGGSIADWLCRRVGPSGRVLATDIDTRFLEALDRPNLDVRRHDIAAEDLPAGAFDLVHTRTVLNHVGARTEALRRMADAVRPGGWLLVEEGDWGWWMPDPATDSAASALFRKHWKAHDHFAAARGVDHYYGRRLYGDLRALGMGEIGAEGRVAVVQGGSPHAQMWRMSFTRVREPIVAAG